MSQAEIDAKVSAFEKKKGNKKERTISKQREREIEEKFNEMMMKELLMQQDDDEKKSKNIIASSSKIPDISKQSSNITSIDTIVSSPTTTSPQPKKLSRFKQRMLERRHQK